MLIEAIEKDKVPSTMHFVIVKVDYEEDILFIQDVKLGKTMKV